MWFLVFAGAVAFVLYYAGVVGMPKSISDVPGAILGLANAIDRFEDGRAGTDKRGNYNPGNLKYTQWTRSQGAIGKDSAGFCIFPDWTTGWNALIALLLLRRRQHPNWSILDLMMSYAPPSDNNPTQQYAQFVAGYVGGDINTKLGELV